MKNDIFSARLSILSSLYQFAILRPKRERGRNGYTFSFIVFAHLNFSFLIKCFSKTLIRNFFQLLHNPFCWLFGDTLEKAFASNQILHYQASSWRRKWQEELQGSLQGSLYVPLDQRWMFEESEADGPDIWNKSWYPKAADHVNTEKPWFVVDATDKILGRLASTIAVYIRGKNLATYTPSVDMGAFVIVLQQRIPERITEHAVRGMLPKGRLGRALFNHLKVYKGPDHPHEVQMPVELPIRDKRIQRQR
ncbi:hypothetical protein UlMin_027272 [Ulmus minor]